VESPVLEASRQRRDFYEIAFVDSEQILAFATFSGSLLIDVQCKLSNLLFVVKIHLKEFWQRLI